YFLFPLLRRWFNRYGVAPLLLLSLMAMAVINLFMYRFSNTGIDPMALVIGHLPLFCLGLVLAKYKNRPMPLWLFLGACVVFVLGNFYMKAWLFSQLSVTIIFLYVYLFLKQTVKPGAGLFRKSLFFMGNLSMYVFAVNGFLRAPFLQQTAQQPAIGIKCLILAAFLLFVILVALLLRVTEKTMLRLLFKQRKQEQPLEPQASTRTSIG
ncbi:MAG TPA: hypothetical protein VFL47_07995, partial [Flavisolibacter sp.]|nr:hypothetical protein [Flavisolibacter sp.]